MELVLIRHAQPAWSENGQARNNPTLTRLGWQQATQLADAISGPFDHLYVSTMQRAIDTAEPLGAALDIAPDYRDWMEELRNPPEWEGAPAEHIDAAIATGMERSPEEIWEGFPGGESFREMHVRVQNGLESMLAAHCATRSAIHPQLWDIDESGQRIGFVAHGGTIALVLGILLGFDPVAWEWERFRPSHASVSVLRTAPVAGRHTFSLVRFNDVSHLAEETT